MRHLTSRQHYEKYRNMAEKAGISLLNSTCFGTKEKLAKLYDEDKHLNNMPLLRFDYMYYSMVPTAKKVVKSPSEAVCLYKHLIIFEVLKAEPVFTDECYWCGKVTSGSVQVGGKDFSICDDCFKANKQFEHPAKGRISFDVPEDVITKFWVIIDNSGSSWQYFGELEEAIKKYKETHRINEVIAVVSH